MKKKNIFITSTLILLVGGFITRLIGFVIRIIYTREVGPEGIALFSIVMPTYSMLVTIATLALPLTISKLVAEKKTRSIKILSNSTIIIMIINALLIIVTFLSSEFIASSLLNEPRAKYLLIAMSLTLPFVSISSIIKGYFLGKQETMPYMVSNILEQIFRLLMILVFMPKLLDLSIFHAVLGLILLSVFSETFSIIIFFFFVPKKVKLKKEDFTYNPNVKNDILGTAFPTVSSRIIGNVGYFFEPIILTNVLIYMGYSSSFVLAEYGAYNAYAISLLTMPAFFIQALSQTLIPEISKHHANRNLKLIKKRVKQTLSLTFIIGLAFSVFIFLFRDTLLEVLYKTNAGSDYIKVLAPFFTIFYLEAICYSILQAIGKAKHAFKISIIGVIVKLATLTIFSFLKIGVYSLIIAEIVNIIIIVLLNFIALKKEKLI